MIDVARFLGFAFANADLLFEVDKKGKIVFAAGAVGDFVRDKKGDLVGQAAATLFEPSEAVKFATFTHALGNVGRAGPFKLKLSSGSTAALSLFRLPQNGGHVSCTLAKPGARAIAGGSTDPRTGLADRDGFLAAASAMSGDEDELTLLNVPALRQVSERMAPDEADKLFQRIGDTIREAGPKAAARLSDASFGVIAHAAGGANKLGESIRKALQDGGIDSANVEQTLVSLKDNGLSPDQQMLALRYVLDRFGAQASDPDAARDLTTAFDRLMNNTQNRALALTQTLANGSFTLQYQPIVDLATDGVSHYEALSRFSENANTGEIVAFAEALGIADAFDLAVAVKIIALLAKKDSGKSCVAFNISGRTIASPAAFGLLAGLLARNKALAPRLLVEITETAEISDLAAAGKAIQTMREMGFRVGLDDFGAGGASFQYLHHFSVDFVKIDGSLVKRLGISAREDTMVRSIVKMCADLKILTIAECVEDETLLERVRDMGFGFGQGHFLGQPAETLPAAPPPGKSEGRAKRKGLRAIWE